MRVLIRPALIDAECAIVAEAVCECEGAVREEEVVASILPGQSGLVFELQDERGESIPGALDRGIAYALGEFEVFQSMGFPRRGHAAVRELVGVRGPLSFHKLPLLVVGQDYKLGELLRGADDFDCSAMLYVPIERHFRSETPCMALLGDPYEEDETIPEEAQKRGMRPCLQMGVVQEVVWNAGSQVDSITDDELVIALVYYYEHDAFLEIPRAAKESERTKGASDILVCLTDNELSDFWRTRGTVAVTEPVLATCRLSESTRRLLADFGLPRDLHLGITFGVAAHVPRDPSDGSLCIGEDTTGSLWLRAGSERVEILNATDGTFQLVNTSLSHLLHCVTFYEMSLTPSREAPARRARETRARIAACDGKALSEGGYWGEVLEQMEHGLL